VQHLHLEMPQVCVPLLGFEHREQQIQGLEADLLNC
jgi:hypothetical protein